MSNRSGRPKDDSALSLSERRLSLRRKMVDDPGFSLEDLDNEARNRAGSRLAGGDSTGSLGEVAGKPAFAEGKDAVELAARAAFPTRFGDFELYGVLDRRTGFEHTAVVKGDVRGAENCPVRVHSQCHTGDVLGSLRCDCRDQLERALRYIEENGSGVVIYLKQEGRGIGLINKIRAYRLQDLGLDTVEANEYLGFPAENRDYRVAARVFSILGIKSVELMTNNPDKIEKLKAEGIVITGRIPVVTDWNEFNYEYMETKKHQMGHLY